MLTWLQDYLVTRYIAEFINTLSSLVYGKLKPDAPSYLSQEDEES